MAQRQNKNWFERNWMWFVPVGCVTVAVVAIAFVALLVMLVFGIMKSSDAYKNAVAQAKAHPAVMAALGTPIEEGMIVSGNINVNNGSGEANLSIPLSGPNGSGTLYVEATKSTGQWTFSTLVLQTHGSSERINLLEAESDAGSP